MKKDSNKTCFKSLALFIFLFLLPFLSKAQPIKIGIISDLHYLSEQLMDTAFATKKYVHTTGRNIIDMPSILDKVLTDYQALGIDVLLISGDMTKDGEKQSHIYLVEKLKPLQNKGVRVFVVPGNHDINMPNSVAFRGDETIPVENVSPAQFEQIYSECGYSTAINRDKHSLSYVAELTDSIWLLAIDACLYKEYKENSISAGRISAHTEQWILDASKEAKNKNKRLVAMMHHGLVEHFMYQSSLFSEYLVDDWNRLASLFADNGVKVIFTGHFHANDVTEFVSQKKNKVYDIETGTLAAYPHSYRVVSLNSDSMQIFTKNIASLPQNLNLLEHSESQLRELVSKIAFRKIKDRKPDFDDDITRQLAEIAADIFVLHAKGDEVIDNDLKQKIENVAARLDLEVDFSVESLRLDFPPEDNDLTIHF